MLFILLSAVNHELIDVKDTRSIDEESIEPKVKRSLLAIIELDSHIIIDK